MNAIEKNTGEIEKLQQELATCRQSLTDAIAKVQSLKDAIETTEASHNTFITRFTKSEAEIENLNGLLTNLSEIIHTESNKAAEIEDAAKAAEQKINFEVERIEQQSQKIGMDFAKAITDIAALNDSTLKLTNTINTTEALTTKVTEEMQKTEEKIDHSLEQIDTKNSEKMTKIQKDYDEWVMQKGLAIDEKFNPIEIHTTELIEFLESKKNEAIQIVGIIADTGLVGKYKAEADLEKTSGILWRRIGFGLMLLPLVMVFYTVFEFTHDIDFKLAIFRFLAVAALSLPSILALQEMRRHFITSQICRNKELELVSLNPYLDKLPDNEKTLIKKELAKKYFGGNEITQKTGKELDVSIKLDKNHIEALFKKAIS